MMCSGDSPGRVCAPVRPFQAGVQPHDFLFIKKCVEITVEFFILIKILILPCEREIGAEAGTTGLGFLEIIIRVRNKLRHFLFILFMFDLKLEETRVVIRNDMIVDIHHGD